jgi:hypothetical protein
VLAPSTPAVSRPPTARCAREPLFSARRKNAHTHARVVAERVREADARENDSLALV